MPIAMTPILIGSFRISLLISLPICLLFFTSRGHTNFFSLLKVRIANHKIEKLITIVFPSISCPKIADRTVAVLYRLLADNYQLSSSANTF